MKKRIIALGLTLAVLCLLPACKNKTKSTDISSVQNEAEISLTSISPTRTGGLIGESKRVQASYFDDVVFVGDSISEGLHLYEDTNDVLGGAQFLTSVSLSATNALWDVSARSVHPQWNGQKMKVEQAIPLTGAQKVYLMLGMNDIISVGVDRAVVNFEEICNRILQKAPQVQLYVQSVTPLLGAGRTSDGHTLSNQTISQYNQKLLSLCQNRGWNYLNVAEALRDANGRLTASYCSDRNGMGMHLTFAGCAAWTEYLYTHTTQFAQ